MSISPFLLAATILASGSMNLTTLDTSYKRNYTVLSVFDWLIPLSVVFLSFIHVVAFNGISLLFNKIPCVHVCACAGNV